MRYLLILFLAILITACGKEKHDLVVKGIIKDLKKGTVYLQKMQDSTLIIVDSLVINGSPEFELHSDIESPEIFYLYLDKNSSDGDRITFFADKGITEINTTLKNFVFDAKIIGSEQQKTLESYNLLKTRLNNRNLDLIKEDFDAQKAGDTAKLNKIDAQYNNLLKSKYLQTVNFALNNKDSEVAPYLVLTEIYDARINYLDTINNSLSPEVKASKYGKQLQEFIDQIKNQ